MALRQVRICGRGVVYAEFLFPGNGSSRYRFGPLSVRVTVCALRRTGTDLRYGSFANVSAQQVAQKVAKIAQTTAIASGGFDS